MFVHTVIMVIEPHMKQGRQHKLISTIFLATSVTKKLDHNMGIPEHYAATIANSRRKYWYISNNKAVIWALNKERLINSGYYDLATAYQSVHVNY